ncbi:molybdopterin-dependent oxidoreductase [Halomonas ramblicola]|uniref:molybdopterin-dependent oxidoreductase n=1 Tax=Halomonas ramblicola TaxID=747349 RepID=UPI0025B5856D|nr:molybdopterin-dependent oxidoreductase [Halomonas ramblicola]MDN3521700.1 molybdopterin-dependent oxidoreductase [Halomonas ramblicola]
MRHRFLRLLFPLSLLAFLLPAWGADSSLPPPEGKVLLTISGNIEHANSGDEARFDREMLASLAWQEVETRTPWHDDRGTFAGPLLRDVLAAAGVRSERVRVRALNGFEAEIPLPELHDYDVILAMRRNGRPMPIREFGPLFVLYPFDAHPELDTETVRFRSVWQVRHIHAL